LLVYRAFKFVLDLNQKEKQILEDMATASRFAYNFAVDLSQALYEADLPRADLDWFPEDSEKLTSQRLDNRSLVKDEVGSKTGNYRLSTTTLDVENDPDDLIVNKPTTHKNKSRVKQINPSSPKTIQSKADYKIPFNPARELDDFGLNRMWVKYWRYLASDLPAVAYGAGEIAYQAFTQYFDAKGGAIAQIVKNKTGSGRKVSLPGFRSRWDSHQAFSLIRIKVLETSDSKNNAKCNLIKIPNNPKPLKVKGSTRRLLYFLKQYQGKIQVAHFTRSSPNREWEVSIVAEVDISTLDLDLLNSSKPTPLNEQLDSAITSNPLATLAAQDFLAISSEDIVGLDLGLTYLATLSSGEHIENPRFLKRYLTKLGRLQRAIARSEKERKLLEELLHEQNMLMGRQRISKSQRRQEKEKQLSGLHQKISAMRRSYFRMIAQGLVKRYKIIGIEDLAVANMVQNRKLSRAISDVAWATFIAILEEEAAKVGTLIVKADRFYPSSQKCSNCAYLNKDTKDLALRLWVCPVCQYFHNDRDINAGINLIPTAEQIAKALEERRVKYQIEMKRRSLRIQITAKTAETRKQKKKLRSQATLEQRALTNDASLNSNLSSNIAAKNPSPGVTPERLNAPGEPQTPLSNSKILKDRNATQDSNILTERRIELSLLSLEKSSTESLSLEGFETG
jgi:IS605 OrfB family transposase